MNNFIYNSVKIFLKKKKLFWSRDPSQCSASPQTEQRKGEFKKSVMWIRGLLDPDPGEENRRKSQK